MNKFFLLLFFCLIGCSSNKINEKEFLTNKIFYLAGHNTENTFNNCIGFLSKPNHIITANHCITNNFQLSFIKESNKIELFNEILYQNSFMDILKLKTNNNINESYIKASSTTLDNEFLIATLEKNTLLMIKCTLIKDDILIPHAKCDHEIKKGFSGSPILSLNLEYFGVLIGVDKEDKNIVYFSLI